MDWKDGFAKDQLEKYGWVEGSGLGKSEHGITEAIKVKIKNDTRGVGHDAAEEFTFHWWDHVFNKAANSIKVKTSEEGVLVQKESDSGKISSSKAGMKTFDNKQMLYGRFIKSATLMNTGQTIEEEKSESSSESEDETKAMRCVDDIMFKKCGGRTAHKGARHGLGLSGKLARIEEQERLLSEAVKTEGQRSPNGMEENREHKKKLKKSKKSKQDKSEIVTSCDASEKTQKEKKSKKRQSHMADSDDLSNDIEQEEIPKKKSKKKKDHENSDDIKCETSENGKLSGALHSKGKPKKSKKRSVENDPDMLHVSINDLSNSGNLKTNGSLKKISKKKKLSDADVDSELQERVDVSVDFGSVDAPKKSKKKKKRNVEKCLEQQDKHGVEINDDSCEQTENGEENEEFHENVKSERKKKKKKRKQQENE